MREAWPLRHSSLVSFSTAHFSFAVGYSHSSNIQMEVVNADDLPRETGVLQQRMELSRVSLMDSLILRQQQFVHQFSNIYRLRLAKLRPFLESVTPFTLFDIYFRPLARRKWGDSISVAPQLIDSEYHPDEVIEVVIIGNIFKELKLRPSVTRSGVNLFDFCRFWPNIVSQGKLENSTRCLRIIIPRFSDSITW